MCSVWLAITSLIFFILYTSVLSDWSSSIFSYSLCFFKRIERAIPLSISVSQNVLMTTPSVIAITTRPSMDDSFVFCCPVFIYVITHRALPSILNIKDTLASLVNKFSIALQYNFHQEEVDIYGQGNSCRLDIKSLSQYRVYIFRPA